MNKKIIFGLIIGFLIIVIVSVISQLLYLSNISDTQDPITTCDKIKNQFVKNACYEDIAKERQDISICDKIYDQERKDRCYSRVAKVARDLSICDKIQYQEWKNDCYSEIAQVKQDILICDRISDQEWKDHVRLGVVLTPLCTGPLSMAFTSFTDNCSSLPCSVNSGRSRDATPRSSRISSLQTRSPRSPRLSVM